MKRQNSRTAQRKKIDRTVTKKCPTCSRECPVARKSCECGLQFGSRTRTVPSRTERVVTPKVTAEDPELTESKRRRFRTKRMRPDFFNPLDMEYSSRRKVKVPEVKKRRGRPKGAVNKPSKPKPSSLSKPKPEQESKPTPPPEEENNMYANMPSEKMLQFNIILQELNHKFFRQNFKPL
ncbi:uncharacterized protein LOC143283709 [Babylonia areolata]|uniref:uncharacterized protein LOC143283709 n=1 Tax=Babylonia areolata TaxID=304850 RepID=UPI003FD23358